MKALFCLSAYTTVLTFMFMYVYRLSGSREVVELRNSFTPGQMAIYDSIKTERRNHYVIGLFLGLVVAWLYSRQRKCSGARAICCFVGIVGQWCLKSPDSQFHWPTQSGRCN